MTLAVEDIVNIALDEIGYPKHIGDIYEGSPASRVALEIYGQTRDELLQLGDWPFALREAALTAAGPVPPSPWAYEYGYPSDCLRIRYVRPRPLTGGTRSNDPQPVLFRPWNDNRITPDVRAILCDLSAPILIYNGRVTNPDTWEPEFTKALISALAQKMSFMLPQSSDTTKARVILAQQDVVSGMAVDDLSAPNSGITVNGNQR